MGFTKEITDLSDWNHYYGGLETVSEEKTLERTKYGWSKTKVVFSLDDRTYYRLTWGRSEKDHPEEGDGNFFLVTEVEPYEVTLVEYREVI